MVIYIIIKQAYCLSLYGLMLIKKVINASEIFPRQNETLLHLNSFFIVFIGC